MKTRSLHFTNSSGFWYIASRRQVMMFFLLLEPEVLEKYNSCDSHQNMSQFLKKGRSLFVVVPTAPLQNYENFTKTVLSHNKKEPFFFEIPPIFIKNSFETVSHSIFFLRKYVWLLNRFLQYVSIYAAYLYDSVKLYANALHKLLSEHSPLTEEIIDEVASNGTKIIETIIELKTYRSTFEISLWFSNETTFAINFKVWPEQQWKLTKTVIRKEISQC